MALPKQIGDDVVFQEIRLPSTDPQPLVPGNEPHQNVTGFIVVAHPDNAGRIYVGDSNSQPLPIGSDAGSPSIEFKLSRRRKIYIRAATAGDRVIVITVTTDRCVGTPYE